MATAIERYTLAMRRYQHRAMASGLTGTAFVIMMNWRYPTSLDTQEASLRRYAANPGRPGVESRPRCDVPTAIRRTSFLYRLAADAVARARAAGVEAYAVPCLCEPDEDGRRDPYCDDCAGSGARHRGLRMTLGAGS